ncbi:MAG: hypothetical protein GF364_17770 [Candidatus Lokiarchaeota archaeon]|nr:hypothetical protein [Candidatus Lokiarchaeota archaeon]
MVTEYELPLIHQTGITAIVNLMQDWDYKPGNTIDYLHCGFPDGVSIPMKKIKKIYKFIDKHIVMQKVLVHCALGISRSGGIITGYILRENPTWSWDHAVGFIRKKHYIYPANKIRDSILDYLEEIEGIRRNIRIHYPE